MEESDALLRVPRAQQAFLLRIVMEAPWSIRVADQAPLTVMSQLSGSAWFTADGAQPIVLRPGDVVLARAPNQYQLSSEPGLAPTMLIGEGQSCSGSGGRDLSVELGRGVAAWGNHPDGPDQLIVGTYRSDSEVGRLVLGSLPEWMVVVDPARELIGVLTRELAAEASSSVLDRLLDLVLITTLREGARTGQWRHGTDPVVRATLHAMHQEPAHPWRIADLAERAGVSRATLATRFVRSMGVAPLSYLTRWRLALAADQLRASDSTLESIAHRVGYGTAFSFSAAFKRHFGVSPQRYRQDAGEPHDSVIG